MDNTMLRRKILCRSARLLVLLFGLAIAGACSSMKGIDRQIDALVAERTDILGGGAVPPTLRKSMSNDYSRAGMYDKTPETTNPSASEIEYEEQEFRDMQEVLDRLAEYAEKGAGVRMLSLPESLQITQQSSREYITAEEDYIFSAIRLLIERHLWGPRFFDDISFSTDYDLGDGDGRAALNVINDLRVTQRLPYGGEVEARLLTQATQQLKGIVGDQYTQSSELALTANIPLLRDAGMIAQEDLIQAERDLIYAARRFERFRREYLVQIASDYFTIIALQEALANQERSVESRRQNADRQKQLVEAGRKRPSESALAEQNYLGSIDSRNRQRDNLIVAMDNFKIRLGIPVDTEIELAPITFELIEPSISLAEAASRALMYRLDFHTSKDQVVDSRRAVENSRNQLLPSLDLTLGASFVNDETDKSQIASYDFNDSRWSGGATLSLPLDRQIERLNLRAAAIQFHRAERNLDRDRDQLIVDARARVRAIDTARSALNLQERSVEVNTFRNEELLAKEDEVDAQSLIDSQNDLLNTQNLRDGAVRNLRTAILNYLVDTGQMRVTSSGQLEPLEGMVIRQIDPAAGQGGNDPDPGP
jgi:outer membrane protein TolC